MVLEFYSSERMVTGFESFQNSIGLWVGKTLVRNNERIRSARIKIIQNDYFVLYKNTPDGIPETIELKHQTFPLQREPRKNAEKNQFLEAHQN